MTSRAPRVNSAGTSCKPASAAEPARVAGASTDAALNAQLALAAALLGKGQAASALSQLKRLQKTALKSGVMAAARVQLLIGQAHAAQGAHNDAMAAWVGALERVAGEPDITIEGCLLLGELHLEQGEAAQAYELIELGCGLAHGRPVAMRAHIDLAAALIALGELALARTALDVAHGQRAMVEHLPLHARLQQ
ncbi:MAG TPA: hypothetical protein VLC08_13270, partial [Chitinolyticbacter sp.]|nr:hypothetical protein [Chitinolyticbacter sp.]